MSRVHLFCNLKSWARTHAVLVIQLLNSLSHPGPLRGRTVNTIRGERTKEQTMNDLLDTAHETIQQPKQTPQENAVNYGATEGGGVHGLLIVGLVLYAAL